MAKLKMPVIQSEELIRFNNKLIEVDEKFLRPEKKINRQTNQRFKKTQPKTFFCH